MGGSEVDNRASFVVASGTRRWGGRRGLGFAARALVSTPEELAHGTQSATSPSLRQARSTSSLLAEEKTNCTASGSLHELALSSLSDYPATWTVTQEACFHFDNARQANTLRFCSFWLHGKCLG